MTKDQLREKAKKYRKTAKDYEYCNNANVIYAVMNALADLFDHLASKEK